METFTYTRPKLDRKSGSPDAYNALLLNTAFHHQSSSTGPIEYWTNGTTTHLMASPQHGAQAEAVSTTTQPSVADPERATVAFTGPATTSATPRSSPYYRHRTTRIMQISRPPVRLPDRARARNEADHHSRLVRNSILAGSCSGMASTFLLYPLDVLRIKLQTVGGGGSGGTGMIAEGPRGPLQMFRHTIQHGGFRALYTGLTLPLAAQAVYKSTVFTVNNVTESFILNWRTLENHKTGIMEDGQLTLMDRYWSGFVGGAVNALLFVTPVEFVRNQQIAQHSRLASGQKVSHMMSSALDVIKFSIRNHGILSLWRGASLSVARDAWGCGFFFLTMAYMQQQFTSYDIDGHATKPSFAATVVSGGLAGLAYWVSALPIDTVKTWVQSSEIGSKNHPPHLQQQRPVSATHEIQRILRYEGPIGLMKQLFRGWQVAYGRGIPSAAITMTVYKYVESYVNAYP